MVFFYINVFPGYLHYRLVSFHHIVAEIGLFGCGHIVVHDTILRIVLAGHLITLLGIEAENHRNDDITQILVAAGERGGLLGSRLGERSGLDLIALADMDCEHLVSSVQAVLDILRVVQVLQNALAECDAVLVDEDVRSSFGVDVDNLKVDSRKIDSHNYSFLSS